MFVTCPPDRSPSEMITCQHITCQALADEEGTVKQEHNGKERKVREFRCFLHHDEFLRQYSRRTFGKVVVRAS